MKKAIIWTAIVALAISCDREVGFRNYTLNFNTPLGPFTMGSEGKHCRKFGPVMLAGGKKDTYIIPNSKAIKYKMVGKDYPWASYGYDGFACTSSENPNKIRI